MHMQQWGDYMRCREVGAAWRGSIQFGSRMSKAILKDRLPVSGTAGRWRNLNFQELGPIGKKLDH